MWKISMQNGSLNTLLTFWTIKVYFWWLIFCDAKIYYHKGKQQAYPMKSYNGITVQSVETSKENSIFQKIKNIYNS